MKMAVAVLVLAGAVHAQEISPLLAAPAEKHRASVAALGKQRLADIATAAGPYLTGLEATEKSATTAGQLEIVAAAMKERDAVRANVLAAEPPKALPRRLQSLRKEFLAARQRIDENYLKRRREVDAEYLRALASLQTRAAADENLARQIAAAKESLLTAGEAVMVGSKMTGVPRGKNVVANGDFTRHTNGVPEAWKGAYGARVEVEADNAFLRLRPGKAAADGTVNWVSLGQDIVWPKAAKKATVIASLRTLDCKSVVKDGVRKPNVSVQFFNDKGGCIGTVAASWEGKNGTWQTIRAEQAVPKDTVKARVSFGNSFCPGQLDFDNIEVTFQ